MNVEQQELSAEAVWTPLPPPSGFDGDLDGGFVLKIFGLQLKLIYTHKKRNLLATMIVILKVFALGVAGCRAQTMS